MLLRTGFLFVLLGWLDASQAASCSSNPAFGQITESCEITSDVTLVPYKPSSGATRFRFLGGQYQTYGVTGNVASTVSTRRQVTIRFVPNNCVYPKLSVDSNAALELDAYVRFVADPLPLTCRAASSSQLAGGSFWSYGAGPSSTPKQHLQSVNALDTKNRGGQPGSGPSGGLGGGVVDVSCGALTLSGAIMANGQDSASGGAGSGGTIVVTANSIAGNGRIEALGGAGKAGGAGGEVRHAIFNHA
jgi:hypothetical protein